MLIQSKGEPRLEPFLPDCRPAEEYDPDDPQPGLYSGVADEPYYRTAAPSVSGIKPTRPRAKITRRASTVGSAANDLILRESYYETHYVEMDIQPNLTTKVGKAEYAEAEASFPGVQILRRNEWKDARRALDLIWDNDETRKWRDAPGEVELTMISKLRDGITWKGRMDKDTPLYHSDLKVFHCLDEDHFLSMAPKFAYHAQRALYGDQYQTETGVAKPWYWVVVSLQADRAFRVFAPWWVEATGRRYYEDLGYVRQQQGIAEAKR